jgi:PAS domain S-box-containing protein
VPRWRPGTHSTPATYTIRFREPGDNGQRVVSMPLREYLRSIGSTLRHSRAFPILRRTLRTYFQTSAESIPLPDELTRLGSDRAADRNVRDALARQADEAIARRAMSGGLVYFVVSVALALSTPYLHDHPTVLATAASLSLMFGGSRMIGARFLQLKTGDAMQARRVLFAGTFGNFVVWGLFCAWTMQQYAGQWTAMFLLLTSASLAGGATSSLAPNLPLAVRCLTALVVPIVVSAASLGDARHWALAAMAAMYLAFLLAQAHVNWQAFWMATIAAEHERVQRSAERVAAEKERASLVAAVEQCAEAIMITDLRGNIRYCNPAFEKTTGYTHQEVLGRNSSLLKSGRHDHAFYDHLWSTIQGGEVWAGRFINRKKDGSLFEEDAAISAIRDASGTITGYVAAKHDVTERVNLENQLRQSQKLESIGRLAGGVAHDFNNLLTIINGYADLVLRRMEVHDPLHDPLTQIRRAGERAAGLTGQLLAFSRKQVLAPRSVDLNNLIVESRKMFELMAGEDIHIMTELNSQSVVVVADPGQLHQVLMNLVANARDAMARGGRLTLRTSQIRLDPAAASLLPGASASEYGVLEVQDSGVGMSDEVRQKAFDPFFTTKPEGAGTGLGLSTVYGIVQQNRGWIEMHSEPEKGTAIRIGLPLADAGVASETARPSAPAQLSGSETVLVVEDQDDVRTLAIRILRQYRYRTLEARSGDEALQISQGHSGPVHLLLTDVIMPGMTGKELSERLRQSRPDTKVLFMSGYSAEVISRRGLLEPGIHYIEKPFTPEALAQKVRSLLGETRPGEKSVAGE